MGRQIRRVAMDFSWPQNTVYSGYVMPDSLQPTTCPACDGDGASPLAKSLERRWWGHDPIDPYEMGSKPFTPDTPGVMDSCRRKVDNARAFYDDHLGARGEETVRREALRMCAIWNAMWQHHLSQDDVDVLLSSGEVLEGLTHRWHGRERRWQPIDRQPPTQAEVNLWSLGLDRPLAQTPGYAIMKAEAARRGGTLDCSTCDGEGSRFRDEQHRLDHDAWRPIDPPTGEGWQLWETVSEGSPISPVFASAQDLARHLGRVDASRDDGMDEAGWLRFIEKGGWAPSGVMTGCVVVPGHMAVAADIL